MADDWLPSLTKEKIWVNKMAYVQHLLIVICILLAGCSGDFTVLDQHQENEKFLKLNSQQSIDQPISNQAKEIVSRYDEISAVYAVNDSKSMIVAFEVYQFNRFKLKNIRKKIQKIMTDNFPELEFIVSTDQKIVLELKKLEHEIDADSISEKNIHKRIKKITKLAKEQT